MDTVKEKAKPLSHRRYRAAALIATITLSTLIATTWALSDIGEIDGHWGQLAFIFFTWLGVIMAAMILFRTKE